MSGSIDAAAKQNYHKVRFTYVDTTVPAPFYGYAEYTDWTYDLSGVSTGGFKSTPAMEVILPGNNGLLENQEVKIRLPNDVFTLRVSSHEPITRVKAEIWERTQDPTGSGAATELFVFKGYLTCTVRHPMGRRGVVELILKSPKHLLDVPLGMQATPECIWTLGEGKCGAAAAPLSGFTVASITGKLLTVTSIGSYSDYYFHRGFVMRDSLRIGIREWLSADPTKFYMTDVPPQDWIGKGVSIKPGCDKTIECCRDRWNSVETFMGFGYSIPAYQPTQHKAID